MDACSFNWELASKFVPLVTAIVSILIACFVYWAWHQQKGKEVIANEAKEAIKDFLELGNKISNINQMLDHKEIDEDIIVRIKYIYEESNRRLLFLVNSIEIKNLKKNMFDLHVENNKLFNRLDLIHMLKKDYNKEEYKIDPNLINETREIARKSYGLVWDIVYILKPYALYKTKFNYIKDKNV